MADEDRPDLEATELALTQSVRAEDAPTMVSTGSDHFSLVEGESEPAVVWVPDDTTTRLDAGERYEPGPLLGSGGMGQVRLQRDRRIGRQVAMKTLHEGAERLLPRFLHETRIQGQLEHPTIVPVYDLGTLDDGTVFFTMKRVRGQTLARILDHLRDDDAETVEQFSQHRLLGAFAQICRAVQYANSRGVIHRDIKPANIMLGRFGEVHLLDWGIAKVLDAPPVDTTADDGAPLGADALGQSQIDPGSDVMLTAQGEYVGTAVYMPPEQVRGRQSEVDARADVFSLGATLYEILTRDRFRDGQNSMEILALAAECPERRPSDVASDVPPELDEICVRATAADPAKRFQSASELAEAVESYLAGDRDRDLRRSLAAEHVKTVRRRLQQDDSREGGQVETMREVVRAMALDPESHEAQKLLVELVVEGGEMPPEAAAEYRAEERRVFRKNARLGAFGYSTLLAGWPFALAVGIRDWWAISIITVLCLLCIAQAYRMGQSYERRILETSILGLLTAALLVVASAWAGPFVIVPTLASAAVALHATGTTKSERRVYAAFVTTGVLLPFGLEYLALYPPAWTFEAGQLILHPRALNLPEQGTIIAFAWVALSFAALPAFFIGMGRDSLKKAERKLFLQAWNLRQLFATETQATRD